MIRVVYVGQVSNDVVPDLPGPSVKVCLVNKDRWGRLLSNTDQSTGQHLSFGTSRLHRRRGQHSLRKACVIAYLIERIPENRQIVHTLSLAVPELQNATQDSKALA